MAHVNEGSHSFTCRSHVYLQVEWTIPATPLPPGEGSGERDRPFPGKKWIFRLKWRALVNSERYFLSVPLPPIAMQAIYGAWNSKIRQNLGTICTSDPTLKFWVTLSHPRDLRPRKPVLSRTRWRQISRVVFKDETRDTRTTWRLDMTTRLDGPCVSAFRNVHTVSPNRAPTDLGVPHFTHRRTALN